MQITDEDIKTFKKRSRTELASNGDLSRLAWDVVVPALCNELLETRNKLETATKNRWFNAAKLHEALGELSAELWNNTVIAGKLKFKLYEIADAALAAQPRNCDVGTAEEQDVRFGEFCLKHIGCAEETGGKHCLGCPLEKATENITQRCELYWAQLPYKKGETNGSK